MNIEWSSDEEEGIVSMSSHLHTFLHEGKKILWLLPGGSNIAIAVKVLNHLQKHTSSEQFASITVTLTDERYGDVGHIDSNWKQLTEAGFDWSGFATLPVLKDLTLEETTNEWTQELQKILDATDIVLGHFGMGADGHIAGILPHTAAITDATLVSNYETEQFTRITLSVEALKRVDIAYLFAYGAAKEDAVHNLHTGTLSLQEQPAQILRSLSEVHIYTDHVG